jgi:hypothetical protein
MDVPVLPLAGVMHVGLVVGWALLMAWLLVAALHYLSPAPLTRPRRVGAAWLAVGTLLLCLLPGPWSPVFYLGLAFQIPSLMSMVLCAMALWRWLVLAPPSPSPQQSAVHTSGPQPAVMYAALAGVALGWCLMFDTLALVPSSVYAWGYGRYALWGLLGIAWVWMLLLRYVLQASVQRFALPLLLVLLVFAATRLTTGNVWDALLDPWLWLASHVLLGQQVRLLFERRRTAGLK